MRKRVVPIIAWPLRFLRRLPGLLPRPSHKGDKPARPVTPQAAATSQEPATGERAGLKGNPIKKLAGLKGNPIKTVAGLRSKPRIAVFAILAVVVVAAVLALRPAADSDKAVRATLDRYAKATREKDYQTLCDSLFSNNIVDGLRSAGLPCEVALSSSTLKDLRDPQLTVLGVEVTGDHAAARARTSATGEVASVDTIRLVREDGDWRIDSLAEPGDQPAAAAVP